MPIKAYHKLVRDRIPEMIEADQKEYAAKQTVLLYPDCEAMAGQQIPLSYSSPSGSLVRVQTLPLDAPIAMAEAVKQLLDATHQSSKS